MRSPIAIAIAIAIAALLGALAGCDAANARLLLAPVPSTCPREPVSAVRVTLLGDFPPQSATAGVESDMPPQPLPRSGTRSLSVEGLSAKNVAALAWSGPLPPAAEGRVPADGSDRTVPLAYGAPDSLCPVWGLRLPRAFHRATVLPAGPVVVTGGVSADGASDTLEVYRPDAPAIGRPLPLYPGAAIGHSATVLADGGLLVAGGAHPGPKGAAAAIERASIYQADGQAEGGVLLLEGGPRALHAAVQLGDGRVFMAGGCDRVEALPPGQPPSCASRSVLGTSEVYDAEGTGSQPGPALAHPRYGHEALLLGDGRVLLYGGLEVLDRNKPPTPALQAELLDPLDRARAGTLVGRAGASGGRLPGGGLLWADVQGAGVLLPGESSLPLSPVLARAQATLSILPDGAGLLAGGRTESGEVVAAVELFEAGAFRLLADQFSRAGHAAAALPDGTVLLLGGLQQDGSPAPHVSRFIHSLRVADATPPPWPLDPAEGTKWLAPRRAEHVSFDGATLSLVAPAAGAGGRPGELALIAGVRWAGGEVRVDAALPTGAALVLGHQDDENYYFLRLAPGQDLALLQVQGGKVREVPGCRGTAVAAGEVQLALDLQLGQGELALAVGGAERLRCAVDLPRGALGLGSLGGTARFQNLQVGRGP